MHHKTFYALLRRYPDIVITVKRVAGKFYWGSPFNFFDFDDYFQEGMLAIKKIRQKIDMKKPPINKSYIIDRVRRRMVDLYRLEAKYWRGDETYADKYGTDNLK